MDMLSLSVFPYLSIGILGPFFKDREEINNTLSCRKEHFADMLISVVKKVGSSPETDGCLQKIRDIEE